MRKLLLALLFVSLLSVNAFAATTWYVRVNGGTSSQCTGTTNADYGGTGTAQACAFNHPAWVMGAGSGASATTAKWVGGDTMVIDDNSGAAQYMVGYGMPNTAGCSAFAPVDCVLNSIPSGIDINNPTKIRGSAYTSGCATKPQLWGTQSVKQVLKIAGASNVEIQCVEITDHSNCGFRVGPNQCGENYNGTSVGTYGREGIAGAGIANFTLKNVDVHGMSDRGIEVGDLTGTANISHVNIDGNYMAGWDGDTRAVYGGSGAINTGTMVIDHVKNRFNGCQEAYPRSASFSAGDYGNCVDQNSNPPGYGDGWATFDAAGTYNITDSEWSHNAQDGLDFLYCPNNCVFNINRSRFEGNDGNQLKISAKTLNLTNSVLIANCTYLRQAGKIAYPAVWSDCRANGTPMSVTVVAGSTYSIKNVTGYTSTGAGGSAFIEVGDRYGTCNGTETYTYKNNVLYNHNHTWTAYYNGLSGSCSTAWGAAGTTYSDIYNFTSNPSGTGVVTTNPLFTSAVSQTAVDNLAAIALQSGSPAKGTANATTYWNTSNDFNNFPQNSPIDMGSLQFGSSLQLAQGGQSCIANTDCSNNTCTNFACSGSCTANGGACSTGATCCTGTCTASVCATAATCGNGVIESGETCDGSNLNNSNCILQGFTGGSLSCASDCHSFVTSSCTNTTTFPLTPIIDSFTRANSTGISNTSWVNVSGSFNISSNAALPVSGSTAYNRYFWGGSTFQADQEVYVTISNKGTNGDDVDILSRWNQATDLGYKLKTVVASNKLRVFKLSPGEVQLGADIAQAISSGDSIGMSIVGSTITVWYKASGGSWTSLGTRTDSTITAAGVTALTGESGAGATPDIKFTNFGGGSLNPITCGNGLKETGEVCDGTDLAGQSCTTQGFASGTLTCASNCQAFITSSCVSAAVCGNNTKETGEVCDGVDLASQTCAGLGYASGTLTCASNCLSFNTSNCVSSSAGITGGVTLK